MANTKRIVKVDGPDPGEARGVVAAAIAGSEVPKGTRVPREGGRGKSAAADSIGGSRHGVLERQGPRFRIDVGMPMRPTAPEAAYVQANGRVISSAVNRSRVNFFKQLSDLP